MSLTCDYCHGVCEEGATKCSNCGATLGPKAATDYRVAEVTTLATFEIAEIYHKAGEHAYYGYCVALGIKPA